MIYLTLFYEFFKTGLFAIGGGLATLPFLYDISAKYGWFSEAEIINMLAIAESTPGPIAINSATFVGYRTCGVLGAACATFGVVLPSFVIILAISYVLKQFQEITAVKYAFNGIRAGVLALLFKALWGMYKKFPKGWVSYVVMAAAFLLTAVLDVHVLIVIISCAVFGLVTALLAGKKVQR